MCSHKKAFSLFLRACCDLDSEGLLDGQLETVLRRIRAGGPVAC